MTKKLEDFFNIDNTQPDDIEPAYPDDDGPLTTDQLEQVQRSVTVSSATIREVDAAIEKIDVALPTIRDLDASDAEMDDLAKLAQEKFQDLMDLGMNVEPRFSGVILQTASTLLGHAITAKTAKIDKKLKMVQLQLQKAKLDQQIKKENKANENDADEPLSGTGMIIDRDTLLKQILDASKKD
jgi:hypothetical protein